jgi:dynein heavy chain
VISRTTDDWINLGVIDGIRYPLPARIFVKKDMYDLSVRNKEALSHCFDWFYAAVTDYDYEKKLWNVFTLDGLKREFHLPRIYIRFFAEDPKIFAKRVAAAIKQRRITETVIRLI